MMSRLQFKGTAVGNQAAGQDKNQSYDALFQDLIFNYKIIKTLESKNRRYIIVDRLASLLSQEIKVKIRREHINGVFFGYSQFIRFAYISFVFYIASIFIHKGIDDSERCYTAAYVLYVSAVGSGLAIASLPNMSDAREAAHKVFSIVDDIKANSSTLKEESNKAPQLKGHITFENVFFKYQGKDKHVLKNLNLQIPAG